ncbi:MAG: bifunctional riboflavin kinase/FAD synthetase [Parvibaculaceae bacterium]|jgi:riboflavin kinase/FMN adenylyltransferase|nr:bifunctional riboflavin kinase/FAD synthetase [Parvibaculaceae bacterium]
MHVIRHTSDTRPEDRGGAIALGNFDGVHLGHRQVIDGALAAARSNSVPAGVMIFEPHPQQFFFPDKPFFRLTPFRAKTRLLERLGLDYLAALPFDASMAERSAEGFVEDILVKGLGVSHVCVGYDFRFGKGRAGDGPMLQTLGAQHGFGVTIVEEVKTADETYSSTHIREHLAKGEPAAAARLLGHWWSVETHIVSGDKRGRTIGFPTINLPLEEHVEPALGVYAVKVEIEDGPHKGIYDGVANVGRRPTFNKSDVLLEAHVFDFSGDLYGAHASVSFVSYIRPERKFDGLDSLKAQIALDSEEARNRLKSLKEPWR